MSTIEAPRSLFERIFIRINELRERRREVYAYCHDDKHWFRPRYTEAVCPLCHGKVDGKVPAAPLLVRMDRFTMGIVFMGLASVAMAALVIVTYVRA